MCILGHYPSNINNFAGVSRVVYNISHAMCDESPNITMIKKKRNRYILKKNTFEFDGKLPVYTLSYLGLAVHLVKHNYDIINVHNMSSFFSIPFILKKCHFISSKIVFVSHGLVFIEKKEKRYNHPITYQLFQKISLKWADHIIAVSTSLKNDIMQHYSINCDKISIILNAVDSSFFEQKKRPISFSINEQFILYVGEIAQVKGVNYLIEAISHLNIKLVIVGETTPYFEELKNTYRDQFELNKIIHLENLIDDELKYLYSKSLFFVLFSRHEPFGLVVLEAMASGKAVLISDNVGAKEIIDNGVDGFIIPFGDLKGLIDKMEYLINNEEVAIEMGKSARLKAMQNSWKFKAQQYLALFNNTLLPKEL